MIKKLRILDLRRASSSPSIFRSFAIQSPSWEAVCEFKLISFNLLAPCYKRLRKPTEITRNPIGNTYAGVETTQIAWQDMREADREEEWQKRAEESISFIENEIVPTASIIALQEFWLNTWYAAMFEIAFENHGFEMRNFKRTGEKPDAVALAIRKEEFEILDESDIHLCSVGDRVALLLWLRHRKSNKMLLVANTHLSFASTVFDKTHQMRQMHTLIEAIEDYAITSCVGPATRIIAGDFNLELHSSVCDHLRQSGYHSTFEVCPPMQDECWNTQTQNTSSAGSSSGSSSSKRTNENHTASSSGSDNSVVRVASDSSTTAGSEDSTFTSNESYQSFSGAIGNGFISQSLGLPPLPDFAQGLAWLTSGGNKARKKFVSHRTHRNEELGVDHIFVKPEEIDMSITDTDDTTNTSGSKSSSSRNSNKNRRTSIASVIDPENIKGTSDIHSVLFVADTHVIPSNLPINTWAPSFQLSDHRPIAASIVLASSNNQ